MDNRPIGVLDSGMGGLTAVREILKVLPHEDVIYFGDTGRVPYGTRSAKTVTRYAIQDMNFLLSHNVKMIIAACGTVTTTLPEELTTSFSFPYTGVLDPTVKAALKATKNGRIGVIATATTIRTGAYAKALTRGNPEVQVVSRACPLFVPLVENGYTDPDNQVTRLVAEDYLAGLREEGVDTLILGCTHYPVIARIIQKVMGPQVALIDSGKAAADYAKVLLAEKDLLNGKEEDGRHRFFVSDAPAQFSQNAAIFLGGGFSGEVTQVDIAAYPHTISL